MQILNVKMSVNNDIINVQLTSEGNTTNKSLYSDIDDVSQDDPTYVNEEYISNEVSEVKKLSRKRQCDPNSWKQNIRKKRREAGLNYINIKGKAYQERTIKGQCTYSESNSTEECKSLKLSANLNLSLCFLKIKNFFDARDSATAAIAIEPSSEKAYFRRGQAQLALEEGKLALNDFQYVLDLEPNNKAAQAQIITAQKLIKNQLLNEKRIYANMFDKFAKVDAQKEEEIRRQQPDVMKTLGEWGEEERERAPTTFEKENPNILMLNGNGEFKDM